MREWLKKQRVEKGLTQKEVADSINIPVTTYASYEQGWRNPTVNNAKKIGKLLGFDWTFFFEIKLHVSCTI